MESDGQILTKRINDGLVVMTENAALTVTEKGLAAIDADDANEAAMFDEMARENEREIFEGARDAG